jgi:hypothetical protein
MQEISQVMKLKSILRFSNETSFLLVFLIAF